MKLSHSRNYQQISQDEDGVEAPEHQRREKMGERDSTAKKNLLLSVSESRRTAWNFWATFMSPLLILCLIVSNLYAWKNNYPQVPGDSVFCEFSRAALVLIF